jgi:hypothetical protein
MRWAWESTLGGDDPLWTSTPTSTETSTSLLRTLWRRVEVARPELSSRAVWTQWTEPAGNPAGLGALVGLHHRRKPPEGVRSAVTAASHHRCKCASVSRNLGSSSAIVVGTARWWGNLLRGECLAVDGKRFGLHDRPNVSRKAEVATRVHHTELSFCPAPADVRAGQGEQGGHPVPEPGEEGQMHEPPDHPRRESTEAEAAEVHHRPKAPDGRRTAEVSVLEGLESAGARAGGSPAAHRSRRRR